MVQGVHPQVEDQTEEIISLKNRCALYASMIEHLLHCCSVDFLLDMPEQPVSLINWKRLELLEQEKDQNHEMY